MSSQSVDVGEKRFLSHLPAGNRMPAGGHFDRIGRR